MKTCRKCGAEKDESEFLISALGRPTSPCRKCHQVAVLRWQAANPESLRRANNRWRLRNKPKKNQLAKAFAKRYPEKMNARNAKRRATKKSSVAKWANHFFISEIYDLARRRTKMLGFPWHVDHIVPLKSPLVCGLHVENNLQVIPAAQNHQKNNRVWPDMP